MARLEKEVERLGKALEDSLRKGNRSAAPFSRGEPKAGKQSGRQARRPVPDKVDEEIAVPLPPVRPHCRSGVAGKRAVDQYQEDIVRVTVVRGFHVEVGECSCCGRSAQGRHPLHVGRVRIGPCAWLDDTGWRVGGMLRNLRVIGNGSVAVCLIEPHRGFAEATRLVEEESTTVAFAART